MKAAFDPASVRALLHRGIANGWWTPEHLDRASPGFRSNLVLDPRHFRHGYQGIEHRNLLRDTDQLPKAAPEVPSSPCSTPQPPAPVSPTPDPLDVPF